MESRAERRERNRKQKEEGEEKERDAEERRKRVREGGRESDRAVSVNLINVLFKVQSHCTLIKMVSEHFWIITSIH